MITGSKFFPNVFRIGAAPFVNGLEIVAAKEDVAAREESADDCVLDFARILHFVDGDEAELFPPAAADGIVLEKFIGPGNEVGKIDGVVFGKGGVVLPDKVFAIVREPTFEVILNIGKIAQAGDDSFLFSNSMKV